MLATAIPAPATCSNGAGFAVAYDGPAEWRLPTRQPPPCRKTTTGTGSSPAGGSHRSSSSGLTPGIAAYGTPARTLTPEGFSTEYGNGARWAGPGSGKAGGD